MFNLEAFAHRGYHVPWTEPAQHWEHSVCWSVPLRTGTLFGVCLLFCSYLKLLGSLFPGDMPSGVSVEKE